MPSSGRLQSIGTLQRIIFFQRYSQNQALQNGERRDSTVVVDSSDRGRMPTRRQRSADALISSATVAPNEETLFGYSRREEEVDGR